MVTSKKRIGILCSPELSMNEVRFLSNLGKMLHDRVELHLIGTDRISNLKRHYIYYDYPIPLPFRFHVKLGIFYKCYKYLRRVRPAVLFNQTNKYNKDFIIASLGRLFGIKTIVRSGGEAFSLYTKRQGFLRKLKSFLERNIFSRIGFLLADKIVVLGENGKRELTRHGISSKKIVILPQPIDRSQFNKNYDKLEIRNKLGLPSGTKIILFIGRLVYEKGIDIIISLIPKINSLRSDLFFVFIGEGPYKNALNRLKNRYQNVQVVGEVDIKDVDKYIKASDLLLLPSRSEGLPNVILEAMACGVPVCASPVGEIKYLTRNVCYDFDEFMEFLMREEWYPDPLPETFALRKIKRDYLDLFGIKPN